MPTFGKTDTGSLANGVYAGYRYVTKYTLGVEGWADKLTLDVDGLGAGTGAQTIRAIIYADSAGAPAALVAQGTDVVIADGQVRAWVDLPFSGPIHLPAGDYWLGLVAMDGSDSAQAYYDYAAGDGLFKSGGATDPWGGGGSGLDGDVSVYATYTTTPPSPTLDVTAPAGGATVSDVLTVSWAASSLAYHHVQLEYSLDGGTTWGELCAECKTSTSVFVNTRRFPNGSLKLRAVAYTDASSQVVALTSAAITVTVSNAAGTTRNFVGGTDTLTAAIAASAAGDTIVLDGDFPDEGSSVNVNKANLTFVSLHEGSRATLRSRLLINADGVSFKQLVMRDAAAQRSPQPQAKAAWFYDCDVSNGNSGIGAQDGGTLTFDPDGAQDTFWQRCLIHHIGNRTTEYNSAHGLYAENSKRLFVQDTYFWACAGRCIQFYPYVDEATVDYTLMYDSEMSICFSGDTSGGASFGDPDPSAPYRTNRSTVKRSILGMTGGLDRSNSDGIAYANWGHGVGPGTDNYVVESYLHDPPTSGYGAGYYVDTRGGGLAGANNVNGSTPGYADPASGDFRLGAGDPAVGYGPRTAQPVVADVRGGSIGSSEAFDPRLPSAGLRPHAGLTPTDSGPTWAWSWQGASILSSEAWPGGLAGGVDGGNLGSIPFGGSWDAPSALAPHVGLHPGVGLHPASYGHSYALRVYGGAIPYVGSWSPGLSVSVLAAKLYLTVGLSSAVRRLVELSR